MTTTLSLKEAIEQAIAASRSASDAGFEVEVHLHHDAAHVRLYRRADSLTPSKTEESA